MDDPAGRRGGFPDPRSAPAAMPLALGGDLSAERLLAAYSQGIFPWFSSGEPILWWCPDPRMVLFPEELHVPRSLARTIRRSPLSIRWNTAFEAVVEACASVPRPGQEGTWITNAMRAAYQDFHRAGYAMSVEAWEGDTLVGGLYGVSIGRCFFGESMFARRPDASKLCLVALVRRLGELGVELIDCQMHTEHLARFGARDIDRAHFLHRVATLVVEASPIAGLQEMNEGAALEERGSHREKEAS